MNEEPRIKTDTQEQLISALLKAQRPKGFMWGLLLGVVVMAALDLGDAHLCVGACGGSSVIAEAPFAPFAKQQDRVPVN